MSKKDSNNNDTSNFTNTLTQEASRLAKEMPAVSDILVRIVNNLQTKDKKPN